MPGQRVNGANVTNEEHWILDLFYKPEEMQRASAINSLPLISILSTNLLQAFPQYSQIEQSRLFYIIER